jgi:hypothetical protein
LVEPSATFAVRAKPRAKKSRVVAFKDGAFHVAVAAPPVDGAANDELVRVLARALGVAPSAVSIERGQSGRNKLVRVAGLTTEAAIAALSEAAR